MNDEERDFQKILAYQQVGATVGATVGAIIISMGISAISFGANSNGWLLIGIGAFMAIAAPAYFVYQIIRTNPKPKHLDLSKNKILFDEMYDGKEIEFANKGYEVFSVKKLRLTGEPLQYDYSVLKYVEENKMILITEDGENYGGCIENNLPCVKLGQNPTVEDIEKGLEDLKKSNEDIELDTKTDKKKLKT